MALGDPYATVPALRTRLGINDSNEDAQLQDALNVSSRACERVCRRQWNDAGSATARLYDVPSDLICIVDDFSTTTGFVLKTDGDDNGVFETTWTTADYELRPLNGISEGISGWPYWSIHAIGTTLRFPNTKRASVQVTAQWGWATPPPAIKEAVLIAAEEIWKVKDAPFGVAGFGDFGSIRVRENPKVMALLNPYRRKGTRIR